MPPEDCPSAQLLRDAIVTPWSLWSCGTSNCMKAQGIACCQRANGRRGWAAGGVLFAALAVLTPKCPMCIAAWLGALGLSGLAARVDPRWLWLATALAAAVSVASIAQRFPRRRQHHETRNGNT